MGNINFDKPRSRRLKSKQRNKWCSYCEPKTVKAIYRDYSNKLHACRKHEHLLPDDPPEDYSDAEFNLPRYI